MMNLTDSDISFIANALRTVADQYSADAHTMDTNNCPGFAETFRAHRKRALALAERIEAEKAL